MYAYDSKEAFGSWSVKGSGSFPASILRPHQSRWSRWELEIMTQHYYWLPPGELLELLLRSTQDPRKQRVIQHVYEHKRKVVQRGTQSMSE